MSFVLHIQCEMKKKLLMQNLIMLSLEKYLHARKVGDMVTLLLKDTLKKSFCLMHFKVCIFVLSSISLTLIPWSVVK